MEEVNNLRVSSITAYGKCNLYHHGVIQDCIDNFNYEFKKCNIYGIIDEFGNGGAAISCALSGVLQISKGDLYVNNQKVEAQFVRNAGCYVGDDSGRKNRLTRQPFSVCEQIEYGIHQGLSSCNEVEEIKKKFGLSDQRFHRKIKFISGERWKASMAIGYANGKSIYCFPWINTGDIMHLEEHIKLCTKALLEVGAIIIIPTCREAALLEISKDCKFIYLTEPI